jgi:hypothetical protein
VRPELSALLDDELDVAAKAEVEDHLASCAECRRSLRLLEGSRRWLRTQPAEPVPDLSSQIEERIRETRRVSEWRTLARIAAIAALLAAVVVAVSWPRGDRPETVALAGEVTDGLQRAASTLDSYEAEYSIVERGHPEKSVRRYAASILYSAPESIRLEVEERGRVDPDVVSNDFTLTASPRAYSLRGSGTNTTTINRRPFDGSVLLPTDIVLPLQTLADDATFDVLGEEQIGDFNTVHVRLPYGSAAPLIGSLQARGDWRPFHPSDPVDIWLEEETWFPLRFDVRAGTSPDRSVWSAREGVRDRPGEILLTVRAESFSQPEEPSPSGFRVEQRGIVSDSRFEPSPFDAVRAATGGMDEPRGLEPYRAGTAGVAEIISYSDGMSWLRVQRRPGRLFAAFLASAPEEVTLGPGRYGYYLPASGLSPRKILVVGRHSTTTFESNLPRGRLLATVSQTELPGLRAPRLLRGADGSATRYFGAPTGAPGFAASPTWLPRGYDFASSVRLGPTSDTFVTTYRKQESEFEPAGISITQTRGVSAFSPSAEPSLPLDVEGTEARWFPERGELQWLDGRVLRVITVPSLELDLAQKIARSLR